MRHIGVVKWFDIRKGFGFLTDEEGNDYFIHFSAIQGEGFKKLRSNQQVTFEAGKDKNGRAIAVNVVSAESGEQV